MKYTERARTELDTFLSHAEHSLKGRRDVDAADVVAGIREHVEAELSVRAVDPVTVEDVAEVLARVGAPESWIGTLSDDASDFGTQSIDAVSSRVAAAVLTLAVLGIVLLPTRFMPMGFALVLIGVIGARVVLRGGEQPIGPEGRLLRVMWQAGVVAATVALLLAPAALAWGAAQIGGLLEEPLARHVDAVGRARPLRYWAATAAAAGILTGAWWLIIGVIGRPLSARIRSFLGPADFVLPGHAALALARTGALLLAVSLFGMWLL